MTTYAAQILKLCSVKDDTKCVCSCVRHTRSTGCVRRSCVRVVHRRGSLLTLVTELHKAFKLIRFSRLPPSRSSQIANITAKVCGPLNGNPLGWIQRRCPHGRNPTTPTSPVNPSEDSTKPNIGSSTRLSAHYPQS